jgi:hypothetical protein
MTNEQDFSAIFGECAKFSEYAVGQVVRYVSDGRIQTGEITWTTPADATHPLEYWVVHCPYCRTTHSPEAVQYCKQRYGKQG